MATYTKISDFTLFAPQIICNCSVPISTLHIDNLSELLCFTTDNTFPNTIPLNSDEVSTNDSTSNPPIDSFSDNCSGVVFISTSSFNQF